MTFYVFIFFPLPSQARTFPELLSLIREGKDPCMPCPQEGYTGMGTHIAYDMLTSKNEASLKALSTVSFIFTLDFSHFLPYYFSLFSSVHLRSS